jgi:ribosomal protein S27E
MATDDECPVCHTTIRVEAGFEGDGGDQRAECPSCGAELVRPEGRGWNVAGDAPAG